MFGLKCVFIITYSKTEVTFRPRSVRGGSVGPGVGVTKNLSVW